LTLLAKPLRHSPDGRNIGRSVHAQTLILIRPVVAFDKRVLIGSMGRADRDVYTQAMQQPHQWRGKVPALRAPDKAWITIDGDRGGHALLP
jgi:hypothetical protein